MAIEHLHHLVVGAGPVARAVVDALAERDIKPTAVTRSGTEIPGAMAVAADVNDRTAAAALEFDVVYQCAQPPYHRWPDEFPPLQAAIVEACARNDALLVAAENLYGYGPVVGPMHERLALDATTRKGIVRAKMWQELERAHRAGEIRAVSARAADFFGPGVGESAFGERFFSPLLAGKGSQVLGDPDRLHTATFVPDLGEAMVRLAGTPESWGKAWHVPNPETVTVRRFAEMAATAAGVEARLRPMPRWMLRVAGLFIPGAAETVEMYYQFTDDFVVEHHAYSELIGDHATRLDVAIQRTFDSYRQSAR